MATSQIQGRVPKQYGVGLLAVLLVTLAYAVLVMQVEAWFWGVAALASLGLVVFAIYLFYRLVLAVERIAYEQ